MAFPVHLDSKMALRWPKMAPKRPKDCLKRPQDGSGHTFLGSRRGGGRGGDAIRYAWIRVDKGG